MPSPVEFLSQAFEIGDGFLVGVKIAWTQLRTLPGIRFTGKLALCAANYEENAPEAGAEFYSVSMLPK